VPNKVTERRPLISVIVPAYNVAECISATIESVLRQTYSPFELIVVDDGSTDSTGAIVAGFADGVRCVRQSNRGLSAARNAGIRAANGELIAFVDADDLWMPEKLDYQAQMLTRCPHVGWVYSDALVVDNTAMTVLDRVGRTSRLPSGDILRPLFLHNFVASPTPMVRRSAFEQIGGFDESPRIRIAEDWDMWLRLASAFPVTCVQRPLAKIRSHAGSMTGTMDLDVALTSKVAVVEKAVCLRPASLLPLMARAIAEVHMDVGEWRFRRREYDNARAMFATAIRVRPISLRAVAYWLATFLPSRLIHAFVQLRRRFGRSVVAHTLLSQAWWRSGS
jgi:glycosyltransferase involved in cell wall biosynthesis